MEFARLQTEMMATYEYKLHIFTICLQNFSNPNYSNLANAILLRPKVLIEDAPI